MTPPRRLPSSQPGICTIELIGVEPEGPPPALLIELPHGATLPSHYYGYREQLGSTLPRDLEHFFFVNTDVASPECAAAIGRALTEQRPGLGVVLLRSLIPRTFIDCNRVLSASSRAIAEAGVTPGLPPWIQTPADQELLTDRHQRYQQEAQAAFEWVCGSGGIGLMLHTYAPRTVGIRSVDMQIVEKLHAAYQPEVFSGWPLRPEVDLITKTSEGEILADPELIASIIDELQQTGISAGSGETYPLHPATTAYHHAAAYPSRTLCMEIRRDLVVSRFTPFEPMQACSRKVAPIAEAIARAISITVGSS